MAEHGFNHVDESPNRSRGRFLTLVGFGLLAMAGGLGGGLLAGGLGPHAPAQPAPPPNALAQPAPPANNNGGYAAATGVSIKVEGHIIAVDRAAGTITVQHDDGPPTVVALGAGQGPFYVWQKVEVYGTLTSAGSNGATVQAQFIQLKGSDDD
jgi:hypothetical protein